MRVLVLTGPPAEFEMLHQQQAALTAADLRLDTTALSATETAVWLDHVWTIDADQTRDAPRV